MMYLASYIITNYIATYLLDSCSYSFQILAMELAGLEYY